MTSPLNKLSSETKLPEQEHKAERNSSSHTKTQKTTEQIFQTVKARTMEDKIPQKIKTQGLRLFEDIVAKEELTEDKRENRSLNVTSKIKTIKKALESEFQKDGLDKNTVENYVNHTIGEYKAKLKEKSGNVYDAKSFADYITNKNYQVDENGDISVPSYSEEQRFIIKKFVHLKDKGFFTELDDQFVVRYSGAEKAVYCFDNMAVLTAKQAKHAKVLEDEYQMTVNIRVNEMNRVLTAQVEKGVLTQGKVDQLVADYQTALEDTENSGVEDARSFFQSRGVFTTEELRKGASVFDVSEDDIIALAQTIDENLSAIDLTRKKYIDDNVTYYRSVKAECDLKAFISNSNRGGPSINNLSSEQLNVFLESFDKIKTSMENAKLLHGDIKPDNILIFKEVGEDGKVWYKVKISDFGKSQLGVESQVHTGNPRFHKGLWDTFETQADSLNMIKLLTLNSNTKPLVKKDVPNLKAAQEMSMRRVNFIKENKKLSDVADANFGFVLYLQGIAKPNYFSDLHGSFLSRAHSAFKHSGAESRNAAMRNIISTSVLYLNNSKIKIENFSKISIEELKSIELAATRRLESFKLLYSILTSLPTPEAGDRATKDAMRQEILQYNQLLRGILLELQRREREAQGAAR